MHLTAHGVKDGHNYVEHFWLVVFEGTKVFDEDHNFVDEPAFRAVLEHYRTLYAEGLVVGEPS